MSSGGGSRYNDSKNKTQTSAKTAEIDPKKKKEEALNFPNCKHRVQNLEHKNCKKPRLPWRPLGAGEKKFVSKTDPKANRCHLATRVERSVRTNKNGPIQDRLLLLLPLLFCLLLLLLCFHC